LAARWVPTKGLSFYIASPFPRLRLAQSGRSRNAGTARSSCGGGGATVPG
jgi:hypothetical protein